MGSELLAQRTYRDGEGEFTVGLRMPYRDGDDWFCEVFTRGASGESIHVGGVDALQAIRLAIEVVDAVAASRPEAECMGIRGTF